MAKGKKPFVWSGPLTVQDFRDLGVAMIKALAQDQGIEVKRVVFEQKAPLSLRPEDLEDAGPFYSLKVDFEQDPGAGIPIDSPIEQ